MLNRITGEREYNNGKKQMPYFTGLYFKEENVFFALYSSDFLLSYWNVVKDKCKSHYNKEKMDLLVSTINEDSNPVLLKWYFKN